jgi:hypothetical protein
MLNPVPVAAVEVGVTDFNSLPTRDRGGNPLQPETQVPPIRLANADDAPQLMVTTQLSGCTFCVHSSNAGLYVAHIRPPSGQANNIRTLLLEQGRFRNEDGGRDRLPITHVFGPGPNHEYDYQLDVVTIIGVRKPGKGWRIYAQKNNTAYGVTSIKTVCK